MSNANKTQIGGDHYASGIQHWDYVVANDLDYFQAQITKYVTRCRKKHGKQDLEKAKHFIEKYLEVYDKMYPPPEKEEPKIYGNKFVYTESGAKIGEVPVFPDSFTVEGYYGDGTNLYQCKKCRHTYRLQPQFLGELTKHHYQCAATPSKASVPDSGHAGHGYVDQDPGQLRACT